MVGGGTPKAGGRRYSEGKTRLDLIPAEWITALGDIMTMGAKKYDDRNWELGMEWSKCYASLMRHTMAFWRGEDLDQESGLPHVAHIAWNALAIMTYMKTHPELDDRTSSTALDRFGAKKGERWVTDVTTGQLVPKSKANCSMTGGCDGHGCSFNPRCDPELWVEENNAQNIPDMRVPAPEDKLPINDKKRVYDSRTGMPRDVCRD